MIYFLINFSGGGVYPEVLFQVAKYWYELYVRHTPGGELLIENELPHEPVVLDSQGGLGALIEPGPEMQMPPLVMPQPSQSGPPVIGSNGSIVVTTAPPPPYQHPSASSLAPLGQFCTCEICCNDLFIFKCISLF